MIEGSLRLVIDGREHLLGPGETMEIPAGTPHRQLAGDEGTGRVRVQVRPAARTMEFLELLAGGYPRLRSLVGIARFRESRPTLPRLPSREYEFVDEWDVDAPRESVFAAISDARSYPAWWKPVYLSVESSGEPEVGSESRQHFKGRLPYHLRTRSRITRLEAPEAIGAEVDGDLRGTGLWTLTERRTAGRTCASTGACTPTGCCCGCSHRSCGGRCAGTTRGRSRGRGRGWSRTPELSPFQSPPQLDDVGRAPQVGARRLLEAPQAVPERVGMDVQRLGRLLDPHLLLEPHAQGVLELGAEPAERLQRLEVAAGEGLAERVVGEDRRADREVGEAEHALLPEGERGLQRAAGHREGGGQGGEPRRRPDADHHAGDRARGGGGESDEVVVERGREAVGGDPPRRGAVERAGAEGDVLALGVEAVAADSRESSSASMVPSSTASTNASRRCCSSRASCSSISRCAWPTTSITASPHSHSVSEKASTLETSVPRSRASSPKRDQTAEMEIR